MPIESSQQKPEDPAVRYEANRNDERLIVGEGERSVGRIQAAKYETALLRLMRRTGSDALIVNATNAFIDALEKKSWFGKNDEPLSNEYRKQLGEFLVRAAEGLEFDLEWGGRMSESESVVAEQKARWREQHHLPASQAESKS